MQFFALVWDVHGALCVRAIVYAFVFMLQRGIKLIWEPGLLNLLLKLVSYRKLISKAREEEVDKGRRQKRRIGMKKWLFFFHQQLDSALFRQILFLLDEPWGLQGEEISFFMRSHFQYFIDVKAQRLNMILHKYQHVGVNQLDLKINQTNFLKWKRVLLCQLSASCWTILRLWKVYFTFFLDRQKLKEDGIWWPVKSHKWLHALCKWHPWCPL